MAAASRSPTGLSDPGNLANSGNRVRKSVPNQAEAVKAVKKPTDIHSGTHASIGSGQILAIGDAARWPDWLEQLVTTGHRVEVVPDAERAFVRCVERVIDLVLVAADVAVDEVAVLERVRRLSPCTRMLLIGDRSERGSAARTSTTGTDDAVRAISSSLSAKAFQREVEEAVRACRMARERRERIDQLRSLVQRCTDAHRTTGDLTQLIQQLPTDAGASAPVLGIDALRRTLDTELDALHASRETADFITRCLPESMVAVWLSGPGDRVGLAACSGHAGPHSDIAVRLMSRVERMQLSNLMIAGGIVSTDDASRWGNPDDAAELEGRWSMLAACRADGRCHAVILILGPRGARPVPAEAALDSVRIMLGNHIGRIERVNLRAVPEWPSSNEAFDHDDGPQGD